MDILNLNTFKIILTSVVISTIVLSYANATMTNYGTFLKKVSPSVLSAYPLTQRRHVSHDQINDDVSFDFLASDSSEFLDVHGCAIFCSLVETCMVAAPHATGCHILGSDAGLPGTESTLDPSEISAVYVPKRDTDTMPCWESHTNSNAVHGLVVTPLSENRPDVYYFGIMGDDVDACKSACATESNCMASVLFLTFGHGDWAGQCYGRSNFAQTIEPTSDVITNFKLPCVDNL